MPVRSVCFIRKEVVVRTWVGSLDIPNGCRDKAGYASLNADDIELSHMQDEEIIEIHPVENMEVEGED